MTTEPFEPFEPKMSNCVNDSSSSARVLYMAGVDDIDVKMISMIIQQLSIDAFCKTGSMDAMLVTCFICAPSIRPKIEKRAFLFFRFFVFFFFFRFFLTSSFLSFFLSIYISIYLFFSLSPLLDFDMTSVGFTLLRCISVAIGLYT